MKHPITKLFLARLRALAAARRAAYPVAGLPALIAPFGPHAVHAELDERQEFIIVNAGSAVVALFGREVVGAPVAGLFEGADQERVKAMLMGALNDRVGCVFGAEARHSRLRATMIEAMLTPEPIEAVRPQRICICLVSFGYPKRYGRRTLPTLTLTGERYIDLDGFAGGRDARPSHRVFRRG